MGWTLGEVARFKVDELKANLEKPGLSRVKMRKPLSSINLRTPESLLCKYAGEIEKRFKRVKPFKLRN